MKTRSIDSSSIDSSSIDSSSIDSSSTDLSSTDSSSTDLSSSDSSSSDSSSSDSSSGDILTIDPEEVSFEEEVGDGSYGTVYQARWNGKDCAVKVMDEKNIFDFEDELTILKKFKKSQIANVVELIGSFKSHPIYCIMLEYMPGGDLYDLIHEKKILPWKARYTIMSDICNGIASMHKLNILHRDIKSENILLTADLHAKLCDFNSSATCRQARRESIPIGTLETMAPEVQRRKPSSKKSDMYSVGMTFWEIVTRRDMFDAVGTPRKRKILRLKETGEPEVIPEWCPKSMAALIRKCWKVSPAERPTAKEALVQVKKLEAPGIDQALLALGIFAAQEAIKEKPRALSLDSGR